MWSFVLKTGKNDYICGCVCPPGIPRGSFYQATGGKWVYVVNADGTKATKRSVRIGRQNPQYYEVIEGLEPGEKIIISSYDSFGDKDELIIK